jgi:hypothetical protein
MVNGFFETVQLPAMAIDAVARVLAQDDLSARRASEVV